MRIAIVTLGRTGTRRMRDHAAALADRGDAVDVIDAAAHGVALAAALMRLPRPDLLLVQTPPASPVLGVAWLVATLRRARLAIDWHNLAHAESAVRLGERHRAVRALARSERRWARRADVHLAPTRAMAAWLHREFGVSATVVFGHPRRDQARPAGADVAALWARVAPAASLGTDRIPLVVCATQWTPDDDFDLLLEALERAERTLAGDGPAGALPKLALTLVGDGALRTPFEGRVARRDLRHIAVRTLTLPPADAQTWIGMADLGLCLRQSASGLDLPEALADFRGAGVPVAAFDYAPVLAEALRPGEEGVTFRDAQGLADLLVRMATAGPGPGTPLARAKTWLLEHPAERWEDHWPARAGAQL